MSDHVSLASIHGLLIHRPVGLCTPTPFATSYVVAAACLNACFHEEEGISMLVAAEECISWCDLFITTRGDACVSTVESEEVSEIPSINETITEESQTKPENMNETKPGRHNVAFEKSNLCSLGC